jgi:hypothetical protein
MKRYHGSRPSILDFVSTRYAVGYACGAAALRTVMQTPTQRLRDYKMNLLKSSVLRMSVRRFWT